MDGIGLAARVESLEASNRRLRAFGGLLAVGLAAVVALGQAAPLPKALEGESLTLRDKAGKRRVHLGAGDGDSWAVTVFDAQEKPRAAVRVGGKGTPQVEVLDAEGGRGAELSAIGESAGLYLRAAGGKLRGTFITFRDLPMWDLMDVTGMTRCGASISKAGSAGLSLFGKDGATRAGLISENDDSVRLTLWTGPKGKGYDAVELKTGPGGASNLVLKDLKERSTLAFGVMPDGSAGLNVLAPDRKPRIALTSSLDHTAFVLADGSGRKLMEVQALRKEALPVEIVDKVAPASLVLSDWEGTETFRAPAAAPEPDAGPGGEGEGKQPPSGK